MNQTNILLETGTNELEALELVIEDRDEEGGPRRRLFGINVAKVMQVIANPGLLKPDSADNPAFLGMISIRGHMAPVLDLSVMLGIDRVARDTDVIIVTEFSRTVIGFMVSGVVDIHRMGWDRVEPPDRLLNSVARGVIVGLVDMKDRYIQILDMESLLSEIAPATLDELSPPRVSPTRFKALVADDSDAIRVMLRKLLLAANIEPMIVNTGEEALERLMRAKEESARDGRPLSDFVDILITDIEMPRMDGYSLTKAVKTDSVLKDLPVVLYSSIIYDEVLHKGESVLADVQISKPELPRMAEIVLELLESKGGIER